MAIEWNIERIPSIAFLFTGGMHQALHLAPVAAEMAASNAAEVTCFARTAGERDQLQQLLADLGAPAVSMKIMRLPAWLAPLGRMVRRKWRPMKAPRLIANRRWFSRFDALVTAERTSTILKRLPGPKPFMIHIPHGAGDRARSLDNRIRLFDHVIVAGPKDRRRMIAEGLVDQDHCDIAGYVKLAGVRRLAAGRPAKLFDNRPTIVYNAHFDDALSSWERFAAPLIDAVALDGRFNLIVAPHVRLFQGSTPEVRSAWENRSTPDRIIIDLGSPRSRDMTYIRAADIYVGDVSSQIYEFLATPRPCIFINAHGVDWKGSADYAMWRLGPVVGDMDGLLKELGSAEARHADYIDLQRAAIADTFGDAGDEAPAIAARQIIAAVARKGATKARCAGVFPNRDYASHT